MRQKLLTFFIIVLALFFAFFFFKNTPKMKSGEKAPFVDLLDEEGKTISLQKYFGKVMVLNFWASWCPPCLQEIPSLETLQNQFKSSDFILVAINRDSRNFSKSKKSVEEVRRLLHFTFPVFYDVDESMAELYGVYSLPSSFIIGRDGKIVEEIEGAVDWRNPKILGFIKEALKE